MPMIRSISNLRPSFHTNSRGRIWPSGVNSTLTCTYTHISKQSADIALGVDADGAGDQGMVFGYATDETQEMLPIPFVLATKSLELLKDTGADGLLPDAKSQVTYDYRRNRIDTFLISTQHRADVDLEDVRSLVRDVMVDTALYYNKNIDFRTLVNPTGRFVIGGSFADTGVTGRKIVADTYGGACRHGGGAFSGKDPTKLDRSGAYMARKIAKDIIRSGFARRVEVQLAYATLVLCVYFRLPAALQRQHMG